MNSSPLIQQLGHNCDAPGKIWFHTPSIQDDKLWVYIQWSCYQDRLIKAIPSPQIDQRAKERCPLAPKSSAQILITCVLLSCFSRVQLFMTLWTVALQAPLSMGFSRQEYWNGLPCPPPGDLPNAGIKPTSLISPALAGGFFTTSAGVIEIHVFSATCLFFQPYSVVASLKQPPMSQASWPSCELVWLPPTLTWAANWIQWK